MGNAASNDASAPQDDTTNSDAPVSTSTGNVNGGLDEVIKLVAEIHELEAQHRKKLERNVFMRDELQECRDGAKELIELLQKQTKSN